jgi:predicted O-methyltransferase YrrM
MRPFDPLAYPTCFLQPARLTHSEWIEHLPFGKALIEMARPRVLVELGTFRGVSFCGFCQAIAKLDLPARAYAVDTWQGDEHSGWMASKIYDELRAYHQPRYGNFSELIRDTFDGALSRFADRSIDLLHIDGYHTEAAVRHDYQSWLPKMSERGVILFHDIAVRQRDFGVWKVWREIKQRYRTVEFYHQHGLGLAATGPNCPPALEPLLNSLPERLETIRRFYCRLGSSIRYRYERDLARAKWAKLKRKGITKKLWRLALFPFPKFRAS